MEGIMPIAKHLQDEFEQICSSAMDFEEQSNRELGNFLNLFDNFIAKVDNLSDNAEQLCSNINSLIGDLILNELDPIPDLEKHCDKIYNELDILRNYFFSDKAINIDEIEIVEQINNEIIEEEEPAPALNDEDDDIFLDFLQEASEYVEVLESEIMNLENNPTNTEIINNVFRPFHTLKGVSGFMGLKKLNTISHETENILDKARNGKLRITENIIQGILTSVDAIKYILANLTVQNRVEQISRADFDTIILTLNKLTEQDPSEVATNLPAFQKVESDAPIHKTSSNENRVRIKTEKLDYLIDMVGELVINANLLRQDTEIQKVKNLDSIRKLTQLERVVSELQKASMSLRMIPISSTFQKMKRVVRDYTHKSGKNIELVLVGEETEIDRNIVDSLYDPLVHMIRNSCDHGLEDPKEREKSGKKKTGKVTLDAYHKGNNIIIEVKDDGKGLNRDKILEKAREKGLIAEDETPADSVIYKMIMAAGFSTADKITDVSGRGVGMDVVRQSIEALGGRIDIDSSPGNGSCFTISLPLTLAIIEGMTVKVGTEVFILPVLNVKRTIQPELKNINHVAGNINSLKHQDRLLPIVKLHQIFDITDSIENYEEALMIIVGAGDKEYALMVDKLIGIQDIVIKTLGHKFKNLKGISGGTIMGDGNVGLILDVNSLVEYVK
jgi:two-component system chemotaxis sensor kinase CheA